MIDWMAEQMWEQEGYTFKGEFEGEENMTDFTDKAKQHCHICGQKYYPQEGKMCDCWRCQNCAEEFSDFDCLGNREKWLCNYCEDERYKEEVKH